MHGCLSGAFYTGVDPYRISEGKLENWLGMDFTPLVAALVIGRIEWAILLVYKWSNTNISDEVQRMLCVSIVIYQRQEENLRTETRALRC